MRRWSFGLLGAGLALAGCGGLKSRLSANADTAAEAGAHKLSSEKVASVLARSGGGPTLQAAQFVSNLWLDYALFADAVANGAIKTDSATIARVMWPEISQARVRIFHDSVAASRGGPAALAIDSAYRSPDLRVFQHIIVIPKGTTASDTAAAKKAIQDAAAKIKGGASFGQVASQISADGSKQDQGYLPVGGRGQFVKEFEEPAWGLEPGQVSGVVQSQFGFHLIRRPPLDEARPRFESYLKQRGGSKSDSIYVADLAKNAGLKVAAGAGAAIRNAALDPEGSKNSNRTLVSLKGGDLTVSELIKWMAQFPPNVKAQLQNAPDSVLAQYAQGLAQNVLILREADKAKVALKPDQWKFVELKYNQSVSALRQSLGLEVAELADSSKLTSGQKETVAAQKVDDYFDRLVTGQAQMQMVLPEIAADLRGQGKGRVNQAGVSRALELAMAQVRRDSAAGGGRQGPPPGVEKAPGGPPIGGAQPKPGSGNQ
jgi:hypothetical protein